MVIAVFINIAIAHSPEHFSQMGESNEKWIRGLKNSKGVLCCDGKDGFDAQYDTKDGQYRVYLYNQWWVVPDEALIDEPNKLGVAQVWYSTYWNKPNVPTVMIRCFIPGAGG